MNLSVRESLAEHARVFVTPRRNIAKFTAVIASSSQYLINTISQAYTAIES